MCCIFSPPLRLTKRQPTPFPAPLRTHTQLASDIRGLITQLFESMEAEHGETFISHAFALLTAAYRGLSDAEMEDILSCDEKVMLWSLLQPCQGPPCRRLNLSMQHRR